MSDEGVCLRQVHQLPAIRSSPSGSSSRILLLPIPASMLDVAVEYTAGERHVDELFTQELFGSRVRRRRAVAGRRPPASLEALMRQGVVHPAGRAQARPRSSSRRSAWRWKAATAQAYRGFIEGWTTEALGELMLRARELRHERLSYDDLGEGERARVDRSGAPDPGLRRDGRLRGDLLRHRGHPAARGRLLHRADPGLLRHRRPRSEVASLFWSDACWFIMGSLMFAAAFVKTGVDKRICLILFRSLARPSVRWITGDPDPGHRPGRGLHLRPRPGRDVPADRDDPLHQQPDPRGTRRTRSWPRC